MNPFSKFRVYHRLPGESQLGTTGYPASEIAAQVTWQIRSSDHRLPGEANFEPQVTRPGEVGDQVTRRAEVRTTGYLARRFSQVTWREQVTWRAEVREQVTRRGEVGDQVTRPSEFTA